MIVAKNGNIGSPLTVRVPSKRDQDRAVALTGQVLSRRPGSAFAGQQSHPLTILPNTPPPAGGRGRGRGEHRDV